VKTPKLYWVDIGLLRCTAGLGQTITGTTFENYVVSEVWKWCKTAAPEVGLYFYRTRSGMEVDLLLETEQGLLGMEVKGRERVTPSDGTSLNRLADAVGARWLGGLVIYRGDRIEELGDKVWAIPSWRLLGGMKR
jgi:predicted AAA+ superfamily ATPase